MTKIKEVIIVEGRDDEINLKKYFDCEVIRTNGFGISKETYEKIKLANTRAGVIILTDPDYAGKMIRKRISEVIPSAKHAYITEEEGRSKNDIGVENASEEALINALKSVKTIKNKKNKTFSKKDLYKFGLIGGSDSSNKRKELGNKLKIGYCNGKQLLKRLNSYEIKKEEFLEAMKEIEKNV